MQHNSLYQTFSAATRRLALVLCLWVPGVFAADSAPKPINVLILSPSTNPWNEQTTDGLLAHFGKEDAYVVLHREIVNPSGKRGVPAVSVEQLNARYANANIDYVIATTPTEGMLPYLKKAGNTLLPNAIKVYQSKSGRTFTATQSSDVPNTLLVEPPVFIDKALEQALQLHQPKQLYLFTNPQSNGYLDKTLVAAVETLKQQGTLTAKVNYMPLMSTQGYIDYLRAQPAKDGMVFFTAEFKDANGPVVPAAMINTIATAIEMPVVPYFSSMLNGKGTLGGLLQQPFMHGELLADVVLEHQQGRLFDYQTYLAEMVFAFAIFLAGWVLLVWMVRRRTASLKRAEQKLSLANQQLSSDLFKSQQRALHIQTNLNETGVGLIILSLETGKVLDANQKWADTLGYSLEELKQLSLSDIDQSIPEHKIRKALKGIQRDGKRHLQSRQRTKDGQLIDVDVSLVVAEATDDLPAHIVSFVVGISKEKAQATRLQQMYSAMAASRIGYVVLSLDGVKVLDLNSAMADLWGLSKEEALKLEIKDIDALKTPDEVQQAAFAVKQAGMLTFNMMHKRKFGEPIDVEVTAIYQPENTEFAESVVCFVRDISVTRKAQKEVQKQQAYFSTVFDSLGASGMGVWMLSYDTKRLVDCTDTFAEGLGYTREEVLKAPVENILTLFSPSVIERAEELSHKRKDLTYPHFEVRTKQGEKKIHRVATYAWSESPWGKNVLVGISSDVTEQVRMTQETKERGQQIEAIFDTAPFAIYIASRDGGIRWCNDNACELFGLFDKQLTATSLNQLMEPASYQQFEQDLKQALKVNELLDLDVSIKHSTKGIVPVRVMGRSVMHDGEQAVIYFAVDQSERLAKENELRRSRDETLQQAQLLREYLDLSPVALSLVEGDDAVKGKVTYVNRAWEKLLGYSLEEIQGESTKHLYVDEESFAFASSTLKEAIEANKAWDFETQQKRKDGSLFNARIQGRYLVADDKIRGINFVQDLTAQQAYEKELISARDQA
jgi:PAS domain S-box-containing protein